MLADVIVCLIESRDSKHKKKTNHIPIYRMNF